MRPTYERGRFPLNPQFAHPRPSHALTESFEDFETSLRQFVACSCDFDALNKQLVHDGRFRDNLAQWIGQLMTIEAATEIAGYCLLGPRTPTGIFGPTAEPIDESVIRGHWRFIGRELRFLPHPA